MCPQNMQNHQNPHWKVVEGRDGWLVISLFHVPSKNAKPLQTFLRRDGGTGRGTYDRQRCKK